MYAIDLGDGKYGFARVLPEPLMEFFDLRLTTIPTIEEVVSHPVLFTLCVMNSAIKRRHWQAVGNAPVDAATFESPYFFKEDALDGTISLYRDGRETPAKSGDVTGLERAAVWSAEHVEDRLRDHFAGRRNKWVESLRLQRRK